MPMSTSSSRSALWTAMALATAALWGLVEVVALARARWRQR